MATLKDIKQNMNAVGKTRQITRAMKMMSTAKLGKINKQLDSDKAFIAKLEQIVRRLDTELNQNKDTDEKVTNKVESAIFILVSGERGLCGGFNYEFNEFSKSIIDSSEAKNKKLIVIGKMGYSYFSKNSYDIMLNLPDLDHNSSNEKLYELTDLIYKKYFSNEVQEVYLIYSSFISASKTYFVAPKVLPLDPEIKFIQDDEENYWNTYISYEYEPSIQTLYERILPMYITSIIQRAIAETLASEQSSRIVAMTSATDRASEMIDDLKLEFNRKRQSIITREIAEVISGIES